MCFSFGLDKAETGYNLLMENALTKSLIFHIHTGLLVVSFYMLFVATLSLIFKKVTFGENWRINLVVYGYKRDVRKQRFWFRYWMVIYIVSFVL